MKIRAPAKINLSLRVLGRRPDGYHRLDTIMVAVNLYDVLEIRKGPRSKTAVGAAASLRVTCDHPLVPDGRENLVYRAAALLLDAAKVFSPLDIHIHKRIPVGAGLGGGSTDAAAALVGINRLLHLRFSPRRLERLASSIGADVPFFIHARPSRARGIGERLTPLTHIPMRWLVIVYPGFPVSTAWAYRNLNRNLTKSRANTSINSLLDSASNFAQMLVNDLETVVIKRHPQIGLLKDELRRAGAAGALMTGSGSAIFGVFSSRNKAQKAYQTLGRTTDNKQVFLAHVINPPKRLADR